MCALLSHALVCAKLAAARARAQKKRRPTRNRAFFFATLCARQTFFSLPRVPRPHRCRAHAHHCARVLRRGQRTNADNPPTNDPPPLHPNSWPPKTSSTGTTAPPTRSTASTGGTTWASTKPCAGWRAALRCLAARPRWRRRSTNGPPFRLRRATTRPKLWRCAALARKGWGRGIECVWSVCVFYLCFFRQCATTNRERNSGFFVSNKPGCVDVLQVLSSVSTK